MNEIIKEFSELTNGNVKEIAILLLLAIVRVLEKKKVIEKTIKKEDEKNNS